LEVGSYSGYVYGLETLFQLINDSNKIPTGIIKDNPILPYRGIMVDTVRHFISVPSLKRILNAMALTKLNIFHWHLFDNEAFPFQSSTNPELQSAAYTKKLTYSRD
jgi:hexosaminidase